MNALAKTPAFDETRAAEFGDRFVAALNGAATCLMVSIGHRSGLFDSMRAEGPGTAADVAARAGLNARYVREWLGAMVTAGIVDLDPQTGIYTLPSEHAAMLTRAAEQANLAVFAQYIPLLGSVEDDILDCFRNGGGVPYERFGRFHEVMAEDSGQSVLPVIDSHILPLVSGLKARLAAGIDVLDVGCGRGRAIVKMAALYPNSRFMGFDTAPKHAFDLVTTFDAVHDQAKPMNVLKGINRALKPGGVYLCQDIKGSSHHHHNIGHPIGTLIYTISCMHCMTVSLAQGGEGLGAMWGRETALAYFNDAGFGDVEVHELEHDIQNYYYVCRA